MWADCRCKYCGISREVRDGIPGMNETALKAANVKMITDGLGQDCPVAALNLMYPFASDYPYAWHWVTITGYAKNTVGEWIAMSTWGERESVDYTVYYNSQRLAGGGYAYFDIEFGSPTA